MTGSTVNISLREDMHEIIASEDIDVHNDSHFKAEIMNSPIVIVKNLLRHSAVDMSQECSFNIDEIFNLYKNQEITVLKQKLDVSGWNLSNEKSSFFERCTIEDYVNYHTLLENIIESRAISSFPNLSESQQDFSLYLKTLSSGCDSPGDGPLPSPTSNKCQESSNIIFERKDREVLHTPSYNYEKVAASSRNRLMLMKQEIIRDICREQNMTVDVISEREVRLTEITTIASSSFTQAVPESLYIRRLLSLSSTKKTNTVTNIECNSHNNMPTIGKAVHILPILWDRIHQTEFIKHNREKLQKSIVQTIENFAMEFTEVQKEMHIAEDSSLKDSITSHEEKIYFDNPCHQISFTDTISEVQDDPKDTTNPPSSSSLPSDLLEQKQIYLNLKRNLDLLTCHHNEVRNLLLHEADNMESSEGNYKSCFIEEICRACRSQYKSPSKMPYHQNCRLLAYATLSLPDAPIKQERNRILNIKCLECGHPFLEDILSLKIWNIKGTSIRRLSTLSEYVIEINIFGTTGIIQADFIRGLPTIHLQKFAQDFLQQYVTCGRFQEELIYLMQHNLLDPWYYTQNKYGSKMGPRDSMIKSLPDHTTQCLNELYRGWIRFCCNVDIRNWTQHMDALKRHIPAWMQFQSSNDILGRLRQDVEGMNSPQVYMKVPGVWTGGHEENLRFRSVNCNNGPGASEWFGVELKYMSIMRDAIIRDFKVDILRDEGLWFPNPEWLHAMNIPYFHGIQRAGDVVILRGDTLHWVRSLGFSVHFSWNFGYFDRDQLLTSMERYDINSILTSTGPAYRSLVPMKTLLLDLSAELLDYLRSSTRRKVSCVISSIPYRPTVDTKMNRFPLDHMIDIENDITFLSWILIRFYESINEFCNQLNEVSILTDLKPKIEAKNSIVAHCDNPSCRREIFEGYVMCRDCGYICLSCASCTPCKNDRKGLAAVRKIQKHSLDSSQRKEIPSSIKSQSTSVFRGKVSKGSNQSIPIDVDAYPLFPHGENSYLFYKSRPSNLQVFCCDLFKKILYTYPHLTSSVMHAVNRIQAFHIFATRTRFDESNILANELGRRVTSTTELKYEEERFKQLHVDRQISDVNDHMMQINHLFIDDFINKSLFESYRIIKSFVKVSKTDSSMQISEIESMRMMNSQENLDATPTKNGTRISGHDYHLLSGVSSIPKSKLFDTVSTRTADVEITESSQEKGIKSMHSCILDESGTQKENKLFDSIATNSTTESNKSVSQLKNPTLTDVPKKRRGRKRKFKAVIPRQELIDKSSTRITQPNSSSLLLMSSSIKSAVDSSTCVRGSETRQVSIEELDSFSLNWAHPTPVTPAIELIQNNHIETENKDISNDIQNIVEKSTSSYDTISHNQAGLINQDESDHNIDRGFNDLCSFIYSQNMQLLTAKLAVHNNVSNSMYHPSNSLIIQHISNDHSMSNDSSKIQLSGHVTQVRNVAMINSQTQNSKVVTALKSSSGPSNLPVSDVFQKSASYNVLMTKGDIVSTNNMMNPVTFKSLSSPVQYFIMDPAKPLSQSNQAVLAQSCMGLPSNIPTNCISGGTRSFYDDGNLRSDLAKFTNNVQVNPSIPKTKSRKHSSVKKETTTKKSKTQLNKPKSSIVPTHFPMQYPVSNKLQQPKVFANNVRNVASSMNNLSSFEALVANDSDPMKVLKAALYRKHTASSVPPPTYEDIAVPARPYEGTVINSHLLNNSSHDSVKSFSSSVSEPPRHTLFHRSYDSSNING